MRHLACSLLVLALAACGEKETATAKAEGAKAAAPAERLPLDAAGVPKFRPGLWEVAKTGGGELPETTRNCLGEEADAQLREMLTRQNGPDCKFQRSNTLSGLKVRADCAQGGGLRTDTSFEITGGETAYTMKLGIYLVKPDGTRDGEEVVAKGRWIGACPPDMKPGDEVGVGDQQG